MDLNCADLARAAVAFVAPKLAAAGGKLVEDGLTAARERVWDWLQRRLTRPAQSAAVTAAAQSPADAAALQDLQTLLQSALEQQAELRRELLALLPEPAKSGLSQTAHVTGNANVTIQSTGSGNISVSPPGSPPPGMMGRL